jgi:RimJ/RimL family protein N-acetyltransferase
MKWGVRRYRTADNKSTYAALVRVRTARAAKTKDDVDSIINTMSKKEKKFLNFDGKEYLSFEEGQFVVKRFLYKYGNKPISFLDLLRDGDDLAVVIGTRSGKEYRGKGYARKLTERGMKWVNKNMDKWENIRWSVNNKNYKSIGLAKKLNFELDKNTSGNEWLDYVYTQHKKGE